jgi:hypothetical protein
MVTEALRDDDLPSRLSHQGYRLLHKRWPRFFAIQHKNRAVADSVGGHITRQLFQPVPAERLHGLFFQFLVAFHAHRLAILQRDELARMIGGQNCIAITIFDAREIQFLRAITVVAETAHPGRL